MQKYLNKVYQKISICFSSSVFCCISRIT
uniref:Uncharacterized protein n=1 Tax=Arundo donax TaxID=35708 RepID=A0A0A9BA89_ARUDO